MIRKVTSAVDAVHLYDALHEKHRYVRALRIDMARKPREGRCVNPRCRFTRWHVSYSRTKGERTLCAACGTPWPMDLVSDHGGSGFRARPPLEEELDLIAELGRIFDRLLMWERRVLFAWARLSRGRSGNVAWRVTGALREAYPRALGGWHERRVVRLFRSACSETERRLDRVNLLEHRTYRRRSRGVDGQANLYCAAGG